MCKLQPLASIVESILVSCEAMIVVVAILGHAGIAVDIVCLLVVEEYAELHMSFSFMIYDTFLSSKFASSC
jgi:hypothetical protein